MGFLRDQNLEQKKKLVSKIIAKLKELFPETKIALNYSNNFELLVAVILSAQCTDKKVNEVTKKLFKKYITLDDYITAQKEESEEEFENDIRPTGFFRQKAKNILNCAKIIKEKFNKQVPKSMEEILTLPGVARKTANIVLGNAYNIVEGIAVDTHVKRLAGILCLSSEKTPEKIEKDLMMIVPKEEWMNFSYRLIDYGRKYCPAKKHKHELCPLSIRQDL